MKFAIATLFAAVVAADNLSDLNKAPSAPSASDYLDQGLISAPSASDYTGGRPSVDSVGGSFKSSMGKFGLGGARSGLSGLSMRGNGIGSSFTKGFGGFGGMKGGISGMRKGIQSNGLADVGNRGGLRGTGNMGGFGSRGAGAAFGGSFGGLDNARGSFMDGGYGYDTGYGNAGYTDYAGNTSRLGGYGGYGVNNGSVTGIDYGQVNYQGTNYGNLGYNRAGVGGKVGSYGGRVGYGDAGRVARLDTVGVQGYQFGSGYGNGVGHGYG